MMARVNIDFKDDARRCAPINDRRGMNMRLHEISRFKMGAALSAYRREHYNTHRLSREYASIAGDIARR